MFQDSKITDEKDVGDMIWALANKKKQVLKEIMLEVFDGLVGDSQEPTAGEENTQKL